MISYLKPEVLAEAVRDLDSDDVVDLLEDLRRTTNPNLDALDDRIGSWLNRRAIPEDGGALDAARSRQSA